MPAFTVLTLTTTFFALWGIVVPDAQSTEPVAPLYGGLSTVVMLTAFWDGWRTSTGEERQRYGWLLASMGTSSFFTTLSTVPGFAPGDANTVSFLVVNTAYISSLLAMETGVAYAVLKHRVFNFGFAVNRALFYSATTLILLIAFGIIEWLSEHFLHFEGRETNVLVDGAIALGVYLTFHKVRHVFEHWLERIFFHKWHVNEAKLRKFVIQAAHITTTDVLLRDFRSELKRFGGGATCAIYMRDVEGNYSSTAAPYADTTDCIDVNDHICVALRSDRAPMVVNDEHSIHPRELALPMCHRGDLHGFVLLRAKLDGEEYRPDEVDVLAFATHQVGLDLYALRVEKLEAYLAKAHSEANTLRSLIMQDRISSHALERRGQV